MKKVISVLASILLAAVMAVSIAACGGGTGALDTPQNFTIDASGAYAFDAVSGADRYTLNVYRASDYDTATDTVAEGATAEFTATLRTNSGTVSGLSSIPWDSYVAVLQARAANDSSREDSGVATATFAKGGKLSTPEFWVYAGTAMSMGPGPGEEDSGDGEDVSQDVPESGTGEEGPSEGGGFPGMGGSSDATPMLYIVINTDNYLTMAFANEAVYSFAYEVYADEAMTELLYSEDVFADNIQEASFTLYSGNEATIDISEFWTEEYTTWYVRVKANGNEAQNVEESDWTELFEITFNNTSTVPFDYGFGRESNIFGGGEEA